MGCTELSCPQHGRENREQERECQAYVQWLESSLPNVVRGADMERIDRHYADARGRRHYGH